MVKGEWIKIKSYKSKCDYITAYNEDDGITPKGSALWKTEDKTKHPKDTKDMDRSETIWKDDGKYLLLLLVDLGLLCLVILISFVSPIIAVGAILFFAWATMNTYKAWLESRQKKNAESNTTLSIQMHSEGERIFGSQNNFEDGAPISSDSVFYQRRQEEANKSKSQKKKKLVV